jgi:hypothetical protein
MLLDNGAFSTFLLMMAIKILPHAQKTGVPKGIRTPVTAVKGRCPRPLDDGDV